MGTPPVSTQVSSQLGRSFVRDLNRKKRILKFHCSKYQEQRRFELYRLCGVTSALHGMLHRFNPRSQFKEETFEKNPLRDVVLCSILKMVLKIVCHFRKKRIPATLHWWFRISHFAFACKKAFRTLPKPQVIPLLERWIWNSFTTNMNAVP